MKIKHLPHNQSIPEQLGTDHDLPGWLLNAGIFQPLKYERQSLHSFTDKFSESDEPSKIGALLSHLYGILRRIFKHPYP